MKGFNLTYYLFRPQQLVTWSSKNISSYLFKTRTVSVSNFPKVIQKLSIEMCAIIQKTYAAVICSRPAVVS
jgi:hypothetical protein